MKIHYAAGDLVRLNTKRTNEIMILEIEADELATRYHYGEKNFKSYSSYSLIREHDSEYSEDC